MMEIELDTFEDLAKSDKEGLKLRAGILSCKVQQTLGEIVRLIDNIEE